MSTVRSAFSVKGVLLSTLTTELHQVSTFQYDQKYTYTLYVILAPKKTKHRLHVQY